MPGPRGHWREFAWRAVSTGGSLYGFVMIWMFVTVSVAGLWSVLSLAGERRAEFSLIVNVSVFLGEIVGGVVLFPLRKKRLTTHHIKHGFKRIADARELKDAIARLEGALDDLQEYLETQMGGRQFQPYLLRGIYEGGKLPDAELPRTSADLARAIALDVFDKARSEGFPWPSLAAVAGSLGEALDSDAPDQRLCGHLGDLYMRVAPWYRRFAVSPPPGPVSRFVSVHEKAIAVIIALVSAIGAIVGLLT